MKRIISLLMSIVLVAAVAIMPAGCKKKNETTAAPEEEKYGTHTAVVEELGYPFVSGGASDFTIVIPAECSDTEKTAQEELTYFIGEATGCRLDFVYDDAASYDPAAKYVSIGQTKLLSDAGIVVNYKALKSTGFRLKTVGNTLFIIGQSEGYGVLYGVYEFLKYAIGFEVYATTEVQYENKTVVPAQKFDVLEIPAMEITLVTNARWTNPLQLFRMRELRQTEEFGFLYGIGHTITEQIVPVGSYPGRSNRDGSTEPWYWYEDGYSDPQPCLTNVAMMDEIVKVVTRDLLADKSKMNVFLGQSDGYHKCGCARCEEARRQYGPEESALLMRFMNYVSERVMSNLALAGDTRDITFGTFAYAHTKEPPVRVAEDGTITPTDPSVVPNDNVAVMFAPLEASYIVPFSHPDNKGVYDRLMQWKTIAKKIWSWLYGVNYYEYFIGLDNFGTLKDNYIALASVNTQISYIYGNYGGNSNLVDLREYLYSNLSWDPYRDQDELVDEFMKGYYYDAAPYMREYYDYLRAHYAWLRSEMSDKGYRGTLYVSHTAEMWPDSVLTEMQTILDKAYAAIEKYRDTDMYTYEKLHDRINEETMSYRYLRIEFHSKLYPSSFIKQMIDDFEEDCVKHELIWWKESSTATIASKLAEWRNKL